MKYIKKIGYLVLGIFIFLLLTGCKNKAERQLSEIYKKTAISEKGVKSYRAKVSITSKDININYTILNKENKKYELLINNNNEPKTYEFSSDNEENKKNNNGIDKEEENSEIIVKDRYIHTDSFLDVLNDKDINLTSEKEILNNEEYVRYKFRVKKDTINKILKVYNIVVKTDGDGYALVDKNEHVFLISYDIDSVNVVVSYSRMNE